MVKLIETMTQACKAACAASVMLAASMATAGTVRAELQPVSATACEPLNLYGGSVIEAREAAFERARWMALEMGGVNLQQMMTVENFELTNQEATSAAAGTLTNVQVLKEYKADNDTKFCVDISAELDPDQIRQQLADQAVFRAALAKRSQFLNSPKSPLCVDEVALDNTFTVPLAGRSVSDARDEALMQSKVEAISSAKYTVINSLSGASLNAASGEVQDRVVQRMRARSQGMARATIWREETLDIDGASHARFETVTLVCVPKDPAGLPLPVYFGSFDDGAGAPLPIWQDRLAGSISARDNVDQVSEEALAEITLSAEVARLTCEKRRLGAGASARFPAGDYEVVSATLTGRGNDLVTGKTFTEQATGEKFFSTNGMCERNKDQYMATLVAKLADAMYLRAMQTYRAGSAAAEAKPKVRKRRRF